MGEQPPGGVKLPEVATPSEKTVQQIAAAGAQGGRTRRRQWKRGSIQAELDYSIKVRPDVWARALELAEDPRCIQIVNEVEVIVWNHGPPWPHD